MSDDKYEAMVRLDAKLDELEVEYANKIASRPSPALIELMANIVAIDIYVDGYLSRMDKMPLADEDDEDEEEDKKK